MSENDTHATAEIQIEEFGRKIKASHDALNKASSLTKILWEDLFALQEGTIGDPGKENDPSSSMQQKRRTYVRSAYALIEGICFSLKILSLDGPIQLSEQDRLFCLEKQYELSDKGELKFRNAQIRFLPNLRYSFDVFIRSHGLSIPSPDYSHSGFLHLQNGVKIRDRLMHPKSIENLLISPQELSDCTQGIVWMSKEHQRIVQAGLAGANLLHMKAHGFSVGI